MTRMGSSDDMAENTWMVDGNPRSFATVAAARAAAMAFIADAEANGLQGYNTSDYFIRHRVSKEVFAVESASA